MSSDLLELARSRTRDVLARTAGDPAAAERETGFQAMVAELATGFLGLGGEATHAVLGDSLARIAEFAGAERAVLVRIGADRLVRVLHEWSADLPSGFLRSIDGLPLLPWAGGELARGVTLQYHDPDDLPADAPVERATWKLFGIRSILALPVRSQDGRLLGVAAFATVTRSASWRDEELGLFDLAGGMLRSAFEQQELRTRLEHGERRLRAVLDSGALGILSADADGRIWQANDAALVVLGASRSAMEAGRLRWDAVTPPEYRPLTASALEQIERSGSSDPWEQDIYRADGSRRSILVCIGRVDDGRDRLLIYAVDITSTKTAERRLAQRSRLARLVTLFSTRMIAMPAARVGETIDEALREVGQVLGIDRCTVWLDEDGSTSVARLSHAWDRSGAQVPFHAVPAFDRSRFPKWDEDFRNRRAMIVHDVEKQFPRESAEYAYLRSNGVRSGVAVPLVGSRIPIGFATFASPAVVEWPESVVALLSVIGEIFAAAITRARNEDRQRRVHAELKAAIAERTAQLEGANHELEAFSYAVSHDLRAPLRGVDGFSRILVEDHAGGLPPDARGILERIRATSQRMGDLIDALLRLSRIIRAEPHFERTDLSALAREAAAQVSSGDPGRAVEFRIEEGVATMGEPRLLAALLDNLFRNAWKFTARRAVGHVEFGVEREGEEPVYFVRDDGIGFDASQAERIFMPFQRLNDPREFEGHGVGLATVKRIVGVHGGRVWAEGSPDAGATIRFTLKGRR